MKTAGAPLDARAFDCLLEALANQLGPDALPAHAGAETSLIVLAAAHVANPAHHPLGAIGKVRPPPLSKQRAYFPGQPQNNVTGSCCSSAGRSLPNRSPLLLSRQRTDPRH